MIITFINGSLLSASGGLAKLPGHRTAV